jgi:gliding motility-associated lipoprotein GldH
MKMKQVLTLGVIALALFLVSCDRSKVFEENTVIDKNIWSSKNKISYSVDIQDTVSKHNLYLNVRNAQHYPFDRIFVFLKTATPDKQQFLDTISCILQENGQWLGKGAGDIFDNQILFKKDFVFKKAGKYDFQIEQATRANDLPGVMDVGLRIEKVEQK